MTNASRLYNQLSTILYGQAWYGTPIYTIIDGITFESAFEKVPGASHTIAEILMHMLSWTEEVTSRMRGNTAGTPVGGNWPDVGEPDEQKLQQMVNNFKLANVELLQLIDEFPEDKWSQATNDERGHYSGDELSYEAMIAGLIQHHVYHAGQIVLLNKMSNG
jgi:uncharacterized damage-inducible protein DinB